MSYLTDIPTSSTDYGINKLLITRGLSIDWKHRDSEIHLRNPDLLTQISSNITLTEIYRTRSNQLRYIYHISRSTMKKKDPNSLVNSFTNMHYDTLREICSNTFIDFELLKKLKDNKINLTKNLIENSTVFSFKATQQEIIKYIIKHKLTVPKTILNVNNIIQLLPELQKNISTILYDETTFQESEQISLWVCNFHLFSYIEENSGLKSIKFKTDSKLPKLIKF